MTLEGEITPRLTISVFVCMIYCKRQWCVCIWNVLQLWPFNSTVLVHNQHIFLLNLSNSWGNEKKTNENIETMMSLSFYNTNFHFQMQPSLKQPWIQKLSMRYYPINKNIEHVLFQIIIQITNNLFSFQILNILQLQFFLPN